MPKTSLNYNVPAVLTAERKTELKFKPVTKADAPVIAQALASNPWRTCDFSLGGIMMWVDYFNYEYAMVRGTLFIRGLDECDRRHPAYAVPVGGELSLPEAVDMLRDYCDAHGESLLFSAVPEDAVDRLTLIGATSITPLEDWADYLYDAQDLATLKGHKYNKKRNHVNRFDAENPDAVLEEMTAENARECIEMLQNLKTGEKADEAMAEYERRQTEQVLSDLGSYPGFIGGVLRGQSGNVVAFTVGEIIGDTLILHIEKMDHSVEGAGESINKRFAAYAVSKYPQIKYINREEDAGDPGLRRAKESYNPLALLKKYNVRM